jgi:hypothetical protein
MMTRKRAKWVCKKRARLISMTTWRKTTIHKARKKFKKHLSQRPPLGRTMILLMMIT